MGGLLKSSLSCLVPLAFQIRVHASHLIYLVLLLIELIVDNIVPRLVYLGSLLIYLARSNSYKTTHHQQQQQQPASAKATTTTNTGNNSSSKPALATELNDMSLKRRGKCGSVAGLVWIHRAYVTINLKGPLTRVQDLFPILESNVEDCQVSSTSFVASETVGVVSRTGWFQHASIVMAPTY
eukprot:4824582-Amphidinium_carterae.1